jgi:Kyakuja-Dileera-Zisupton transposase
MFRFLNADYALSGALKGCEKIQRICLSYDVACGYLVHAVDRFRKHFPDQLSLLQSILFLIPKAHLVGHQELCQLLYSFNYTDEVGRTHGEVVEQGWWKGNENAASTREMSPGHRHDTLNDQHSAMNLDKIIGLGKYVQ